MTEKDFTRIVKQVVDEVVVPLVKDVVAEEVERRFVDQNYYVRNLLEKQKQEVWESYARSRHNEVVQQLSNAIAALSIGKESD